MGAVTWGHRAGQPPPPLCPPLVSGRGAGGRAGQVVWKLGFCVRGAGYPGKASKLGRPGQATCLWCDLGPVPAPSEPVS